MKKEEKFTLDVEIKATTKNLTENIKDVTAARTKFNKVMDNSNGKSGRLPRTCL